jgi:hypothetical protein
VAVSLLDKFYALDGKLDANVAVINPTVFLGYILAVVSGQK